MQVTFIAGYVIAFTAGWKMTLVITAVLPLLVFASAMETKFMRGFADQVHNFLLPLKSLSHFPGLVLRSFKILVVYTSASKDCLKKADG